MQAKDVLKKALSSTQHLLAGYFSDLSDADLLIRPVPSANHIAWQVGHLIASEAFLLGSALPGATYPELPDALKNEGSGQSAKTPPAAGYMKKDDYLQWFNKVRQASIANVDRMADADFDKPNTGPLSNFAPNLGDLVILVANHTLMHAGQFTVVRRALGKPVLF